MDALAVAFPLRVACVDVGSNAIRCVAAEFQDESRHKVLLQERAPVRLGHSSFTVGGIDNEAMDAAAQALAGFRRQLDGLGVTHVRAVATSAVREAANQELFVRRMRREAKFDVEVVSGAEEARLVHAAVTRRIAMNSRPWMLMDLGGGSVEISLVDGQGIQWSESHPMGTVRLLEEFHACKGDTRRFQKLIAETVETLRIASAPSRRPAGLAATGGNIEELARLAGLPETDSKVDELPVKRLHEVLERLARLSVEDRIRDLGLRPDRADVIVPAALIYEHVAGLAGMESIHVPHVGLKEGVLYDLVDTLAVHTDPKTKTEHVVLDGSVALGRRFQFEEAHGVQVARLALSLFDQLQPLHRLKTADRSILQAAAVLHDVGRLLGDSKHHKHSYYLISQSEVPGLSEHETELAAQVGRYHRRKEPTPDHEPFARLSEGDRNRVNKLAAILRVADALDREHRRAVKAVKVRRGKGTTTLRLKGEGDFALESWAVQEKGSLFCRTFNTTLEIKKEGEP